MIYQKSHRTLIFWVVMVSFIFFGLGCEKQKEVIEKIGNKPLPPDAFKAAISIENPPSSLKKASTTPIKVKVKNTSSSFWPVKGQPDGSYQIRCSYHWLDKNGKVINWEGIRATLPHDLESNQEVVLNAKVMAPDKPGEYILEFDLIQQKVAWFSKRGSQTLRIPIKVE